jgi:antitoxin PrlF
MAVMHLHYPKNRVEPIALEVAMAAPDLYSESTLTDRYQTTVPDTVRKALGLNRRDKIRYTIGPNGQVVLSRVDLPEDDPVLEQFLSFLARDLTQNPQHLQSISSDLVNRVQSLVAQINLDLDALLCDEDE